MKNIFLGTQQINKLVIITPLLDLNKFKERCSNIEQFSGWYTGVNGVFNKRPLTVIKIIPGTAIGDLALAIADSVERILLVGAAGAINNNLNIGDIFISKTAYNGEGFSRYLENKPAFKETTLTPIKTTFKSKSKYPEHNIYTTGSIVLETPELLENLAKSNADSIDMESSALFSAANSKKIEAAGLYFVSDKPLEKRVFERYTQEEKAALKKTKQKIYLSALELITA